MEQNEKVENPNLFVLHIEVTKKGTLGFQVDAAEGEKQPSLLELVGLLEMAKSDLINGSVEGSKGAIPEGEMVEVILEEGDFELPQGDKLKAMGKKVGDKAKMPKQLAIIREAMLSDIKSGNFDPKDLEKPIDEVVEKAAESVSVEKE